MLASTISNPAPFITRQFMAGNSPAVRIPVGMAFPPKTELVVVREGDRLIVEPKEALQNPLAAIAGHLRALSVVEKLANSRGYLTHFSPS